MAFKSIMVPFFGAAVALGFAALAIARRGTRGHLTTHGQRARFELDPLGPEEDVGDPSELTPRTEAEALAGVGIAWPLMPPATEEELEFDQDDVRATQTADLLDIDIDFDDLEPASTERGLTADLMEQPISGVEAYDAVVPEDLGSEWLARATEAPLTVALDPIDDIIEIPTDSDAVLSEASENAAELPSDDMERSRSPLADDEVEVPKDLWDAFERTRR